MIALFRHPNASSITLVDIVDKKRSKTSVCRRQRGEGNRQAECEENVGVHLSRRLHRPAHEEEE